MNELNYFCNPNAEDTESNPAPAPTWVRPRKVLTSWRRLTVRRGLRNWSSSGDSETSNFFAFIKFSNLSVESHRRIISETPLQYSLYSSPKLFLQCIVERKVESIETVNLVNVDLYQ